MIPSNLIKSKIKVDHEILSKLTLLVLHSFFSGIFASIFFAIANIGFVKNFSSHYIPYAYLASGFIGFLLIQAYRRILKRGGYNAFLLGLLTLLLLTVIFRSLMYFNGATIEKVMSFSVFLFAMPFLSLSWLQQSGLILKTLDFKETKRYSGIINSGATVASILGYLIVPQILPNLQNIYDVLLIAIGGLIIAIFLLTRLKKFIKNDYDFARIEQSNQNVTKEKSLAVLFKQPYVLYIAICSGISMMAFYLIDFSFLNISRKSTNSTAELAGLLSIFFASVKFIELILSLSSAKLFRSFGLKIGIFILPLLCLLLSVISFCSYYFFPTIIFIAAVFTLKLFERTVNKSLEEPTYKSLYQLLPVNERLVIQARIDGGTKQLFIILVGLLLIIFNLFVPAKHADIALLFFIIPLFLYWLISAKKLVALFKKQLVEILKPSSLNEAEDRPKSYKHRLNTLVNNLNAASQEDTFISTILGNKLRILKRKETPEQTKSNAESLYFETQIEAPVLLIFPEQANTSKNKFQSTNEDFLLNALIKDEIPSDEDLTKLAREIKNCKSDYERLLILKIFEKSNSENSFTSLLNLLDYPDYFFVNHLIACLKTKNFKCSTTTVVYFEKVIESTLFDLTFVLSLLSSLNTPEKYQIVFQALLEEELILKKRLLAVLSWKYDASSLSVIEDALFGKQKLYAISNVDIALELLDVLIENDLRAKLSLAFEAGNFHNRFNKFSKWYYVYEENWDDALILILNYNYNKIGVWTKACALKTMLQFPQENFNSAIAGCKYHTNPFLRAIAFEFHAISNGSDYNSLSTKENSLLKSKIGVNYSSGGAELFDLVSHLRAHKFFSQVSSNELVKLISKAKINNKEKKINLTEHTTNVFNIITDGNLTMRYQGAFPKKIFTKNYLSGSMFGEDKITEVSITPESFFYQLPVSDLTDFILSSEDSITYLEKMKF